MRALLCCFLFVYWRVMNARTFDGLELAIFRLIYDFFSQVLYRRNEVTWGIPFFLFVGFLRLL